MAAKRNQDDMSDVAVPDELENPSGGGLVVEKEKGTVYKGNPSVTKPVLRLVSPKLTVVLTDFQLWRLKSGCTSRPHNKDLVLDPSPAHVALLAVYGSSAGGGGTGPRVPQVGGGELCRGRVHPRDVREQRPR